MIVVQLCRGSGRQPYFLRLVSANGETLAVSEQYYSKWNAKRAAAKNFSGIRLVDLTEPRR